MVVCPWCQPWVASLTLWIGSLTLCAGSKPNLSRADSGARPCADFTGMWGEGADCSGGGFEDPCKRVLKGMTIALGFSRDDCGIFILLLSATD